MARTFTIALIATLLFGGIARAQPNDPGLPGTPKRGKAAAADAPVVLEAGVATLEVHRAAGSPANAPLILLVPGLGCLPKDYTLVTAYLQKRGYDVALFQAEGNEELEAETWYKRLTAVTDVLFKENADPKSSLYRSIDMDRLGVIGHSLGGSVATLVAARDPRFKALVAFGPGGKDQGFLDEARSIKGATLVIDGSLDRITPPDTMGAVVAGRTASPYSGHVVIEGGAHTNAPADFNADFIRDSGRFAMTPIPFFPFMTMKYEFPIVPGVKPMPAADQRAIAFSYLGPWLDRFVASKADKDGSTTGKRAADQASAGVLSTAEFSAAAQANGKPPAAAKVSDALRSRGDRGVDSKGLTAPLKAVEDRALAPAGRDR
jgi:dienelactone hydrolase